MQQGYKPDRLEDPCERSIISRRHLPPTIARNIRILFAQKQTESERKVSNERLHRACYRTNEWTGRACSTGRKFPKEMIGRNISSCGTPQQTTRPDFDSRGRLKQEEFYDNARNRGKEKQCVISVAEKY